MTTYTETKKILFEEGANAYYLLGAFITDGNVYKRKNKNHTTECSLSSKDKDWLIAIQKLLNNEPIIKSKNTNLYELRIYNEDVFNWLVSKECVPCKSLTIKMPAIPDQYLPDFIRGCIDGDGSISISKYQQHKNGKTYDRIKKSIYLCGSSYDFLQTLHAKLISIGMVCGLYTIHKKDTMVNGKLIIAKHPHYRIIFNDKCAVTFAQWLYYAGHIISMPRKLAKANEIIGAVNQNRTDTQSLASFNSTIEP